jgi:hypothetical protein
LFCTSDVDGTLTSNAKGGKVIYELGTTNASSSDMDSIVKCSLFTTNNRRGGYCGGTPCCHHTPVLEMAHLVESLVSPASLAM